MTKPIVVGVDGSDSAQQAVRWAAREAARRKAPLRLVHANMVIPAYTTVPVPRSLAQALAEEGRRWLREASQVAQEEEPQIEVSRILERADPPTVLLAESQTAQLMVLGSRGLGGFTGLMVGSVAVKLAQRASCPVVVVRDEHDDTSGKPVILGVDGSPAGEAAIAFAYEQASRWNVPLVAVHTWSDVLPPAAFSIVPHAFDWPEIQTKELELLCERLAGWQEKYPDVQVERIVTQDSPARSLIEQARSAQLVVVGSRGRGALAGLLLGSTSQALLHHAPCPVAVVRPD
ncbi:nucleotide-binding universal stress UspA family protein [Kibdelosporangium banguiense]|uniref:Nucleotide-binding universal stress UspA family protein n=1 Tax=Kibdelosporangium banguiense TaxID=1365924 RepID=A0ABS4TWI2_9PSEU|nr:universal stress protein [Kibdelosporangium banguiense]MBP2328762.1 nucleotide-binding universal stress UspA family protein [Kibdelosporangium banguiense]